MTSILIKNGNIFYENKLVKKNILIENEFIKEITDKEINENNINMSEMQSISEHSQKSVIFDEIINAENKIMPLLLSSFLYLKSAASRFSNQ